MIHLKKIESSEVKVLKEFAVQYMLNADIKARKQEDTYFNDLLKLDLSYTIFIRLRNKIEAAKRGKKISCTFSISEAVILLDVCQDPSIPKKEFETYVSNKVCNLLHEQLINLETS